MTESEVRAVPGWSCASLVAGMSAIFWWLTGLNHHHGLYRIVGPYHFPIMLEIVVGTTAVAAMIMALIVHPVSRLTGGVAWTSAALLVLTGLVATGLWRAATINGEGANIGGGAAILLGPFVVAGLLLSAVLSERSAREGRWRWLPLWLALAALPAVGGIALWTS